MFVLIELEFKVCKYDYNGIFFEKNVFHYSMQFQLEFN